MLDAVNTLRFILIMTLLLTNPHARSEGNLANHCYSNQDEDLVLSFDASPSARPARMRLSPAFTSPHPGLWS